MRDLPQVEALLHRPPLAKALEAHPRSLVVDAVRAVLAGERARLRDGKALRVATPDELARRAAQAAARAAQPGLRRVLNATGIVLHTNLGRSPLSERARQALDEVARGYCNLEYELSSGKRGERGGSVERRLARLTGAEAALVVNNGAAAVLLVLATLAAGKKVVVSRGELVEIGGSFRLPDIMERSGAILVEVGTTNRTHLSDYARAFQRHRDVALVLRVHPSNFRIEGFTTRPPLQALAQLARRRRIPLVEDLGSGALVDLSALGLPKEPTVRESLTAGCDLVTFSGDKLLGATQAGFVLGRKRFVERLRRDALARPLRVDKLTLAACEATLLAYSDPTRAAREIPALRQLTAGAEELERRAHALADAIRARAPALDVAVERGEGEAGGGSLPLVRLPSWVVALSHPQRSADDLERACRASDPPLVGTIRGGRLRLDVRTLSDEEAQEAADALGRLSWPQRDG